MEITAYGKNSEKALKLCEKKIYELDSVFTAERNDGELYRLNESQSATVSDELVNIISDSLRYQSITFGNFDIRVRKLIDIWGFTTGNYCVPDKKQIDEAIPKEQISISGTTISLNGEKLDLGAVAKGYTSAKLACMLKENGVDSALIYLGGNVRAVGSKPDGSDYKIGIKNPFDTEKIIGYVEVSDKAVITSGGYQRFFEKDSKKYHHILNPHSGFPAQSGLSSVTIISSDDALADALSTAVYVGGKELAEELYPELGNFEYILVTDDGTIELSDGIKDRFVRT